MTLYAHLQQPREFRVSEWHVRAPGRQLLDDSAERPERFIDVLRFLPPQRHIRRPVHRVRLLGRLGA
eukprot:6209531-Pleurochrysis_carterae.AAC.2